VGLRSRQRVGTFKAVVLISTACTFAIVFLFLRDAFADYFGYWSAQIGENGKPASKDGDLYLLGVGKADITGYI
jgi:hypothetical protein